MRRALVLISLLALVAVAALALTASAQTPPPSSGDWVITDSTTYANQQISITGNVMVQGNGHLSLTNVNLRFTGNNPHSLQVTSNARLTISGGSISSTGTQHTLNLGGNSAIDGCTITQTGGVSITTWKATFTNNTITRSSGVGISATPGDSYSRALDISDNLVTNASGNGIYVRVPDSGSNSIKVICVGNNVSGSFNDGIRIEASTDQASFFLEGNILYRNSGHGLFGSLSVRTIVDLHIDDTWAKNNTLDGVHITCSASNMWTKYVYSVSSIGNDGEGVYIWFTGQQWPNPVFRRWYIYDNSAGGLNFRGFQCATLENSYNVNSRAQVDYVVSSANLETYGTIHRKGNARVTGPHQVISYRYLNFRATWQNGNPCRSKTVEFENAAGERLFVYTSDYYGQMGNHTEWDWRVRETRSFLRQTFTPYLVGGTQRLTGSTQEFDRDFKEDLVFHDTQTPDLTVKEPTTNDIQNDDVLVITGKCQDAHSGVKVVQISFDNEPSWDKKVWRNATGTNDWNYTLFNAPDDVYNIFVRAFDSASYPSGLYANVTITNVTVDTTPPTLGIIQPMKDIITNQTQITVLGTTDPDVVSLTLNGEELQYFGGTFNKNMILNEGVNNIVIIATDYAGNFANVTRKITVDTIAPIVVVKHPPNDYYTNQSKIQMGGVTDRSGVTMTVDGDPVDSLQSDGTWSHEVDLLKGWNPIVIDAVDVALNHRIITHRIYYDPDPPRINVIKPEAGDIVNSSVFVIMGNTDADVSNQQIKVNGIWIGLENSVFDSEFTLLEEGPTNLTFFARDWAGNTRTVIVPIIIDTTPPTISQLLPIDGEVVNAHVVNVTGVTEVGATLYVDGKYVSLVDGSFMEQVNLEEGDNEVVIRVTDVAGNTRIIRRLIVLDTRPPEIFIDGLIGGDRFRTDQNFLTLTGTTDPGSVLIIAYGAMIGIPTTIETIVVSDDGEWSYPVLLGNNKTTYVLLISTDYAGNSHTEAFMIKKEVEDEPTFTEAHPEVLWGILIVAIVLIVAYPLTKMGLDRTYEHRLKVMGFGSAAQRPPPPPPGQRRPPGPPGQRPPGPPGQRPPGAPPRGPPRRPPGPPPGQAPRPSPRPPSAEEGGEEAAPPAPRPPRDDE